MTDRKTRIVPLPLVTMIGTNGFRRGRSVR